mgnify:CR=1 FL=1
MTTNHESIKLTRWYGAQNPSQQTIAQRMEQEGLRPYRWTNDPNFRYAPRSHGYDKVLYCVQGSVEVILPDTDERVLLRPGDRLDVARGVRHAQIIGPNGAQCLKAIKPHQHRKRCHRRDRSTR